MCRCCDGRRRARRSNWYTAFRIRRSSAKGHLHWDIGGILRGLQDGFIKCAEIATEGIRSIAVDGWAVDYIRLAAGAVRLNAPRTAVGEPFCYRDERTLAAEAALHKVISAERMRAITGVQILRINTVYQMFADELEVKSCGWLNLPEYVLYLLGGRAVSELTNATHTQMVTLDGMWSREIFAAIGQSVEDAPPIVMPGTDVGALQGPLTAIPEFRGTRLIAPACHDTASAIAAIPDAGDDWAYISSGTWSLVGTVLDAPVNSAAARAEEFYEPRRRGQPNLFSQERERPCGCCGSAWIPGVDR